MNIKRKLNHAAYKARKQNTKAETEAEYNEERQQQKTENECIKWQN